MARNKEKPEISGMMQISFDILGNDVKFHTVEKYVLHADCLRKILILGQKKYMCDGDLFGFAKLKIISESGDASTKKLLKKLNETDDKLWIE